MDIKRIFDILFASIGLILLSPVFFLIAILIAIDSKGGVFHRQICVGKNVEDFHLYKFRTVYTHPDNQQLQNVGNQNVKVTKIGYWLRKYKLDELPQLLTILRGHMSIVGPRPEIRKYVNHYNDEQLMVLSVKPGIADLATVEICEESQLLVKSDDPENFYMKELLFLKIKQNLRYINNHNFWIDLKIIFLTLKKLMRS